VSIISPDTGAVAHSVSNHPIFRNIETTPLSKILKIAVIRKYVYRYVAILPSPKVLVLLASILCERIIELKSFILFI